MSLSPSRLIIVGALCFFVGWGLVLVSGHGGSSAGGSEAVWTIGGLMVYASIPLLVIATLWELVARLGSHVRWSGRRS